MGVKTVCLWRSLAWARHAFYLAARLEWIGACARIRIHAIAGGTAGADDTRGGPPIGRQVLLHADKRTAAPRLGDQILEAACALELGSGQPWLFLLQLGTHGLVGGACGESRTRAQVGARRGRDGSGGQVVDRQVVDRHADRLRCHGSCLDGTGRVLPRARGMGMGLRIGIGIGMGKVIAGAGGGRTGSRVMKATSVYCLNCRAGKSRKYRPSACMARISATAAPFRLKLQRICLRVKTTCRWWCNGIRFPVGAGRDSLF